VTDTSSQSASAITQVLRRLQEDQLPPHDTVVALAALIYLRWADFQEAEQEAISAFDETDYRPLLPASMHWRSWYLLSPQELKELFAERLPHALEQLNNFRHHSLATQLHRMAAAVKDLGRLSPRSLDMLVHWLADQPFETSRDRRALLDLFDIAIDSKFDKYAPEFRTPPGIASLLVEIAAPTAEERVYDPCFGSATLLTAAYEHARDKAKVRISRDGAPALKIFGIERNSSAYIIGVTRLALAGINEPQLELGNSLERSPLRNSQRDGFDVVLANPPWGLRVDPVGLDHYPIRTTDSTDLFIQHALSQLRPEGRAVFIVPQGFLFRRGPEQHLRQMLLTQHTVEAVVSLPQGAFLPYTGIQASILVLRRTGPTRRVRMIEAAPFFEKAKGNKATTIRLERAVELAQQLRDPKPGKYYWDIDPESLAEADWDLTPKRRDQSNIKTILDTLGHDIKVAPLNECCQIVAGRSIKSSDLRDKPEGEYPVPYIRIKDVQRGQATKGSSWLTPAVAATVDPQWKLRAGDLLLSKSGTIGKSGVVRNGAVAAVAASGFFIIRPDTERLDPHFLAAYLDSSECRNWLEDRARGAAIRHLSMQALAEMPVPLPPMQIQQRVAAYHRESRGDALAFLSKILIEGIKDPLADWLLSSVGKLTLGEDGKAGVVEDRLIDIAQSGLPLIGEDLSEHATNVESKNSNLHEWIHLLENTLELVTEHDKVPPGPALYSLLKQVEKDLSDASLMPPDGTYEKAAHTLLGALTLWSDTYRERLLTSNKITVSANAQKLRIGKAESLSIEITNSGLLPLRDFWISTKPDMGSGSWTYLAEKSSVILDLTVECPKTHGVFTINLDWHGFALDRSFVQGSIELPFEIVEDALPDTVDFTDLGGSPYVCGNPVPRDRNDVFFGRDELIDQIHRQVIQSGNVVLLEGNRRSGKSSILWRLEGTESVPGWLGVYCSFQQSKGSDKSTGVPTAEVFRSITESIAKAIYKNVDKTIPLPNGETLPKDTRLSITDRKRFGIASRESISEASPFSDFCHYIEFILEVLADKKLGLLLMLDEFDKLQEGIDNKVTSPQVPENIRYLVQSYSHISAILTGSRRLKRLREEYWSVLFGLGTRFSVTALPKESAQLLITEPVKSRLTYAQEAVNRAIHLTARQPFILQCLCSRIFDMAAQLKTRAITLDLVNKAAEALIVDNEHFATLWGYAQTHRRRLILMLIHREGPGPDPLRLGVIQERLYSYGIEVDDESLIADIEFLRELELIDLIKDTTEGRYNLTIPLMGYWIDKQQDLAVVVRKARAETEDQHE